MPLPPQNTPPLQRPKTPVRPLDTTDVVTTPGGVRPRALVHQLEPGQHVSAAGGRIQIIETATGNLVKDLGEVSKAGETTEAGTAPPASAGTVPGIPDNAWIENSQWRNGGSEPIIYFSTTWIVPPAPSSSDGQLVYLFNGMQPDSGAHILQPVLQWGSGGAGGGNYWSITNWYADGQGGAAVHGPLVQVNPGQALQGVMVCTGQGSGGFSYTSSFVGVPSTDVSVTGVPELTWAFETLECYYMQQCSDYPNTPATAMYNIEIRTGKPGTGGTEATIDWGPVTNFRDCGQNCLISSNSSPGGAVYLFYHGIPQADSLVHAVSRAPNYLDAFCVGADHGVYTAAWAPTPGTWQGWWRIGTFVCAPGTTVYGVSRAPNYLDIFAIGEDLGVYTAAWRPGLTAWTSWNRIGTLTVQPNSSVYPVSRSENLLDIFAVASNGAISTAAWAPTPGTWQGWWQIQSGTAAPGTTVYGVSRAPNFLDIFAVGTDLGIYTAAWAPGDKTWQGWWRIQGGVAAPGSSVFAVSRSENLLDVFMVGPDHGIYTAAWAPNPGTWQGWWHIQNGYAAPNTTVFGVSRSENLLDIFCVGTNLGTYTAAWAPTPGTWQGWWIIQSGVAEAGASILPVSRSANLLDIFTVGGGNDIYTAAWAPGDTTWKGWWRILNGVSA